MSDEEDFDATDFDAEVFVAGVTAVATVTGGAWMLARIRKKRDEEEEYILL
mgnify:CR=1 FL=1